MEIIVSNQTESEICIKLVDKQEAFGIDILWLPVMDEYFKQVFAPSIDKVVMNLENADYIDSSALWKLVNYTEILKKQSIGLELSNVNDHILRILKLTRLLNKLTIQ
ncbi:MAG: STAS domain-containing protein [Candidatus Cloacimonetes bacterium]|nr:STAS domain-containing protein [Candidatus Cloacimonadota bacterium]